MRICTAIAATMALAAAALPGLAFAQACGNASGGFDRWQAAYKTRVAAEQGITQATLSSALSGVSYDQSVINLDRGQHSFKLSFEQFYARRVNGALIGRGQSFINSNRALIDRIEKQFGVPGALVVSIWGLETNYARSMNGGKSIFRSLATLAYDCRRSKFFENELTNALKIVQSGDKSVDQMRGGWAGEIGPMQFLPSSYVKHAVDFDGDGKRDLFNSIPDMLASTANFLKGSGWQAGQPWGQGTANYNVIREWNKAEVYVRTIATMATKMAGK